LRSARTRSGKARGSGVVADGTGGTGATSAGGDYSASLGCQKLFAATCARKTACGAYANSPNICLSYNSCAYDAYRWGQDCERRAAGEIFPSAVLDDCEASLRAAPCDAVCGGEPPSACTDVSVLTEDLLNTWFPSCDPECVP
jgi:hypothetical protein